MTFPARLVEHLRACADAGLDGWTLAALRSRPERAAASIDALLDRAAELTGLAPDELIARTGLNAKDLRGNRVDGALAEVRAVCFLGALGFARITPLGPDHRRPRADITAERGGQRWTVDARCASRSLLPEGSFRRGPKGDPLPYPTLHDYLVHCREEKAGQLSRTAADEGCAYAAVVLALEGDMPAEAMRGEAFRAWLSCGGPKDFRFGLMPGLLTLNSAEDALVPAI